jgi:hypothetical protein
MAYHEVDGASTAQHMGTRHYGPATIKPLRRPRVIESGRFRVKLERHMSEALPPVEMREFHLHVAWIDPRTIYPAGLKRLNVDTSTLFSPWIIQVVFPGLN